MPVLLILTVMWHVIFLNNTRFLGFHILSVLCPDQPSYQSGISSDCLPFGTSLLSAHRALHEFWIEHAFQLQQEQ